MSNPYLPAIGDSVGPGDQCKRLEQELRRVGNACRATITFPVREMRKPFDVLAEGLVSEKSRDDGI
jgi:hypothetical protein